MLFDLDVLSNRIRNRWGLVAHLVDFYQRMKTFNRIDQMEHVVLKKCEKFF